MLRFLRLTILLLLLAYSLICAGMYLAQERLIFITKPLRGSSPGLHQFAHDQVGFERQGIKLHGWLINGDRRNLIVYYGGNAEEISGHLPALNDVPGYAALAINYRGYGLSGGQPGAAELKADALWLLKQVRKQYGFHKVVLLGRSLGSGVAMHVAAHARVDGVILVTPYDSLSAVAEGVYPWLPVQLLLKHEFDSLALAPLVRAPVAILAVEPDRIVPTAHAHRLAAALPTLADFRIIRGANHIDVTSHRELWSQATAFAAAIP